MLTMLKSWKGEIEVNGVRYDSVYKIPDLSTFKGDISIKLLHPQENRNSEANRQLKSEDTKQYRITVKAYMTKKSEPGFDFMSRWNNDNPMPLRTMVGTIEKETRGMVYMKLHGDIYAKQICTCMKCGRPLTNPVSQYFGIGPECGGHNYINPFNSDEELKAAVSEYKAKLQNITWEGWIIKSAITEKEEV